MHIVKRRSKKKEKKKERSVPTVLMIRVSWTVAMAENMCLEASFKAWWSSSLFLHCGLGEVGGLLGKSLIEKKNSISYWLLLSRSNDGQLGLSQNPLLFCFCLFGHGLSLVTQIFLWWWVPIVLFVHIVQCCQEETLTGGWSHHCVKSC